MNDYYQKWAKESKASESSNYGFGPFNEFSIKPKEPILTHDGKQVNDKGEEGVWRTIRGHKVFIKDKQTVLDAMKESNLYNNYYFNHNLVMKDEKFEDYKVGRETYSRLVKTPTYVLDENNNRIDFFNKKEYQKVNNDFYNSLTDDEKTALKIYIEGDGYIRMFGQELQDFYQNTMNEIFKNKALTLEKDTLLFRRAREDVEEIYNDLIQRNYYTSTSAYDNIPKTMPSGTPFGNKEYYIIAPAGTKYIPLEKTAVEIVSDDRGEKAIYARQHEILLPKNVKMEMIQDYSSREMKYIKPNDTSRSPVYNHRYVMKIKE